MQRNHLLSGSVVLLLWLLTIWSRRIVTCCCACGDASLFPLPLTCQEGVTRAVETQAIGLSASRAAASRTGAATCVGLR